MAEERKPIKLRKVQWVKVEGGMSMSTDNSSPFHGGGPLRMRAGRRFKKPKNLWFKGKKKKPVLKLKVKDKGTVYEHMTTSKKSIYAAPSAKDKAVGFIKSKFKKGRDYNPVVM